MTKFGKENQNIFLLNIHLQAKSRLFLKIYDWNDWPSNWFNVSSERQGV
jgi:hypothetical protein